MLAEREERKKKRSFTGKITYSGSESDTVVHVRG